MKALVTLRNTLKTYYAEYDFIIRPLLRFLMALSFLVLLKNYIGYHEIAMKPVVLLGASALCCLFPYGCITLVCCLFVLANMYAVSYSFFLIGAILSIFVLFLYFGFRPGHALAIILVPVAFLLKVPYSVPVILGMTVGLGALIPVCVGVGFWFLIDLFHELAPTLTRTTDISALISEFSLIMKELLIAPAVYITLLAFALGIGVAAVFKKMGFSHVWMMTALLSLLTVALTMFVGNALADSALNVREIALFTLLSLPVVVVYVLCFYQVDYKATEHLQFEDDDYYYYVKAVPKVGTEGPADEEE